MGGKEDQESPSPAAGRQPGAGGGHHLLPKADKDAFLQRAKS